MWKSFRQYLEMIRFSHTVFALPFALMAAVLAWGTPTASGERPAFLWRDLMGVLLCMIAARSAAMAFNRLADRKLDAENPRTRSRHLPSGALSAAGVMAFTIACSVGFVAATLLFLPNWLPSALSLPVLAFLFGYSFTKRFTSLAHFWLGAALMLAPICAWIALRGEAVIANPLDIVPALLLGAAVLLWVSGFDMIYACQDVDYDRRARLHSIPAKLGVAGALRLAAACHVGMLAVLAALPWLCPQLPLGWIYAAGWTAVAALLVVEHLLVRPSDLSRVNAAFFHVNAIVSLGLLAIVSLDLVL
jgi:4-hydroxybenzoate polyprenyltransferase